NDMRLIKLQMLLNSLGTFDRPQQPQTVYVGKDQNGNDLYTIPQPQSYSRPNVPLVYPQSGSTYIPVPQGQTRTVVVPNPVGGALQSGIALAATDQTDKEIESLRNRLNLLEAVKRNQLAGNNNVHQLNPQLIDGQVNFPQSDIVVINNERLAPYFKRQVFFRQGSNILDNRSKETLDEVIKLLKEDEMSTLILTGYASPEGAKKFNIELTERRSKAVRQYLSNNGITSDRLRIGDGNIDHTAGIPTVARRVDLTVARKL
ncbi:MAG: OmpA family protein, partial [Porphyromonadaceae bacterium]|nr:OmpA family protein [Porphyromonadaceae bacterium]